MPRLVMIDTRIINIDQIQVVQRTGEGDDLEVKILFSTPKILGEKEVSTLRAMQIMPTNMNFLGPAAQYVWDKISEMAEKWDVPKFP